MPPTRTEEPNRQRRFGFGALAIGSLFVFFAAGALVWSTLATASASFAGSTSNDGSLFEAAMVDLVLGTNPDAATTSLLIDGDGLYPGLVVERCVPVTYRGGLDDIDVRLSGTLESGSGLDAYLRTEIEIGHGTSVTCDDFLGPSTVFSGTLSDFGRDHRSFEDGIELLSGAVDADTISVRVSLEVESDNRAQGLATSFWLVLEARP